MTQAQNAPTVPALALALAVDVADRRRRQIEWLAQKMAAFRHAPTQKDGRRLDCGHSYCRDGCAYCWVEASERATEEPERRTQARDGRAPRQKAGARQ